MNNLTGGFLLKASHVNELVVNSLKQLIIRAKQTSICDVSLRINGNDVRFEADWVKYLEWFDESKLKTTPAVYQIRRVNIRTEQKQAWEEVTEEDYLALQGYKGNGIFAYESRELYEKEIKG